MRRLELKFEPARRLFTLEVTLIDPRARMPWLQEILATRGVEVQRMAISDEGGGQGMVTIEGRVPSPDEIDRIVGELMQAEGTQNVRQYMR